MYVCYVYMTGMMDSSRQALPFQEVVLSCHSVVPPTLEFYYEAVRVLGQSPSASAHDSQPMQSVQVQEQQQEEQQEEGASQGLPQLTSEVL